MSEGHWSTAYPTVPLTAAHEWAKAVGGTTTLSDEDQERILTQLSRWAHLARCHHPPEQHPECGPWQCDGDWYVAAEGAAP